MNRNSVTQVATWMRGDAAVVIRHRGFFTSPSLRCAIGLTLLFVYLTASLGTPVCFDDCKGYIRLMGKEGYDYFDILVRNSFRPWAVPVFFSFFGHYSIESASHIVLAQSLIAFLAWLSLAYAASGLLRSPPMRLFGFVFLSLAMFGQGYYHFNQYLLSDSIALSSVLIQWSLILSFPLFVAWARTRHNERALMTLYLRAVILVSAFEMATRDANIMLALVGWVFLLWANLWGTFSVDKWGRDTLYRFALVVFAIGLAQSQFAQIRHRVNAYNILAGAVIPNEPMRNYFIEHGMPASLQALADGAAPQDLANIDYHEIERIQVLMERADAATQTFIEKVDGLYLGFLATHPRYVVENVWRNWRLIFAFQLGRREDPEAEKFKAERRLVRPGDMTPFVSGSAIDISVADYFPPEFGVALLAGCFILPRLRRDKFAWLPLVLAMTGIINSLASFFGDVWERGEMTRHAAIGSVMLRYGLTLCALMLLDEAVRRARVLGRGARRPAPSRKSLAEEPAAP